MPETTPQGNGITARIARIDERTAHMMTKQDEHHDELCGKLNDHETRIRKLEHNKWWQNAGAALTGAVAGITAGLVGK